jgi:hypothetical protein
MLRSSAFACWNPRSRSAASAGGNPRRVLFGTFQDPRSHAAPRVGIEQDPMPASFLAQLAAPLHWKRIQDA